MLPPSGDFEYKGVPSATPNAITFVILNANNEFYIQIVNGPTSSDAYVDIGLTYTGVMDNSFLLVIQNNPSDSYYFYDGQARFKWNWYTTT